MPSVGNNPPYTPVIPLLRQNAGAFAGEYLVQEGNSNGAAIAQISQPASNGNTTDVTPSANSIVTSTYADGTVHNGLFVISVGYVFDPVQATLGIRRSTGGLLVDDVVIADVQAPDSRAFLYAVDEATPANAKQLLATAAGDLKVATTPIGAATIPTAADLATTAATVTVAIAVNTARRFAIIQNIDATDGVRVGDSSIGAARGILVLPGESVTLETTAEISVFPVANTPTITRTEIV